MSISDMLTRIRNAQSVRMLTIEFPYSKLKHNVLEILKQEGYIDDFEILGDSKKMLLFARLKYTKRGEPCIKEIVGISKPGCRIYSPISSLAKYLNGMGIYILSTSKGVMSDRKAREVNSGGEVLCRVF